MEAPRFTEGGGADGALLEDFFDEEVEGERGEEERLTEGSELRLGARELGPSSEDERARLGADFFVRGAALLGGADLVPLERVALDLPRVVLGSSAREAPLENEPRLDRERKTGSSAPEVPRVIPAPRLEAAPRRAGGDAVNAFLLLVRFMAPDFGETASGRMNAFAFGSCLPNDFGASLRGTPASFSVGWAGLWA